MTVTETDADRLANEGLDAPAEPIDVAATVKPSAEIVVHDGPTNTDIERATDEALMPGVAGRDEFLSLAMQARMLSMSGAAPKAVRNNPYIALHVAMIGRDLGISPSAALELIDVIGKDDKMQLSLSPQLLAGQVRRLGLGRIGRGELTSTHCVAIAYDPHGNVLGETDFTWEDAQIAGLVNRRCTGPTDHNCANLDWKQRCRDGWHNYPKRMLWWRAAGYCVDDFFPEAGLGLYTAEELGAIVDDEGRAIDPSTVALPDGYEPTETPVDPRDELAPEDNRATIKRQIAGLDDDAKARLKTKWKEHKLHDIDYLTKREIGFALEITHAEVVAAHRANEPTGVDAALNMDPATAVEPSESTETPPDGRLTVPAWCAAHNIPAEVEVALAGVPIETVQRAVEAVGLLTPATVSLALADRQTPVPHRVAHRQGLLAALLAVEDHTQETTPPDAVV